MIKIRIQETRFVRLADDVVFCPQLGQKTTLYFSVRKLSSCLFVSLPHRILLLHKSFTVFISLPGNCSDGKPTEYRQWQIYHYLNENSGFNIDNTCFRTGRLHRQGVPGGWLWLPVHGQPASQHSWLGG